ncbi:MAG: GH92 family glycosyl hydrolase [Bacteroidaceae bacterium]|nr:GH92 family glycosyl hydrolase [Bacteroidaceae bacterium]MBP3407706.1 GH92 family glycosyl hydrolase [Bacteroidaceae bacterium]
MRRVLLIISLLVTLATAGAQEKRDYVQYVNPLMGTQSSFELSAGNTYPAIAMPWGMNFWTPRTNRMGDGWQYTYTANRIYGFEQTHQPSPWINDYGQFSLMPVTGKPNLDEKSRASWFSHKSETAQPHYYKVYLADYDIVTELTPTERAAMFRFTFPQADSYIVVDAYDQGSHVEIIPELRMIKGYTTRNSGGVPSNFRNYFVVQFDKPFEHVATFVADSAMQPSLKENTLQQTGYHTGAVIGFSTYKSETVHARVASSFISEEQAMRNLGELGENSFDTLVAQGRDRWNSVLSRIEVEGDIDHMRTFYSCLYRSLLFPRKFYEITADDSILHYSPYNGEVLPGYMYTDTGFWDTFRALFPLLNLVYPSVNAEIQEGLLNSYRESGFFPEWASPGHRGCMVGNNSASVLADAFVKGIRTSDTGLLYQGLQHGANAVHPEVSSTGRTGHEQYNRLGYVPCDAGIHESAARTLEYAYNDWCILQVAKKLERPKKEIRELEKRALNYRNLFRSDYSLMCGRKTDGTFEENFSPLKWGGNFTEGNSWHYTWSVFHDVQGLIELMGGKKNFTTMLDSVFAVPPLYDDSYYGFPIHEIREMTVMNMGNYAHGNQPIQHMIYLYNYAGEPWKAQYRLREVMERMYSPTPDGYCGDEDNGQTSAWYVFSALGFYPVCPASGEYVLGAPLFKRATVHLENGNTFTVEAPENSHENIYIDRMMLNGKEYGHNYITHEALTEGAHINIRMTAQPNHSRGTADEDAPYSFSRE